MNPMLRRMWDDVALVTEATVAGWLEPSEWVDRASLRMADQVSAAEPEFFRRFRESMAPPVTMTEDGFAIIGISGVIAAAPTIPEMLWYGMEDARACSTAIRKAASSPEVKGVLLDIASPGGMVSGGTDVADAARSCRGAKPVVAYTGSTMASLAYMIGSQAHEVIASRMASVGSIGAIVSFVDASRRVENEGLRVETIANREAAKYKGAGTPGTRITDAQREYLQSRVDAAFADFKAMVHSARPEIPAEAMNGKVFFGAEAKQLRLVDRIGDRDFALATLRSLARA